MIYISDLDIYLSPLHIEAVELINTIVSDTYSQWDVFIYTSREKYEYCSGSYEEASKAKKDLIDKVNSYLNALANKNM